MKKGKRSPSPAKVKSIGVPYVERRRRLVEASELLASVATKKAFRPNYKRNTPKAELEYNVFEIGDDIRAVIIGPYLCVAAPDELVPGAAERMTQKQRRHLGKISWRFLVTLPPGFAGLEMFIDRVRARRRRKG